ncbi:NAD(P)/FAD-dependent oxidoreductase [Leuconostoc miyukkimchii]|uniref:NAD(P)/FAD-dependent oxidoreductase n=1 Tax=Leuconostoc miyukkimchii TaxID=910540 RepID=UPI001C7D2BD5|nr:NAD(P)/FAD-dependent oxidoreductase [Leuconostoc miyukkimchii]
MKQEIYDIAVIGGGPVGMFTAFYASLRDTKIVLIESLATLGGQVTALYPEKNILDVAGFYGIKGSAFITELNKQLHVFPVEIKTETTVTNIAKSDGLFTITTHSGETLQAKTVIITTGKGAFEPRKIQIEGVDKLVGQGVHYFVNDVHDFENRHIAIAGGGDSAVDMATMLNSVAASTTIIHRRDTFRAMEQSVNQLMMSTVVRETPKKIVSVTKQTNGQLEITLAEVKNDDITNRIIVDDLIVNYGFISENKTIEGWDIQPKVAGLAFDVNQEMQTSIPGIYAVGDASHYVGKSDLIAIGFGEAPNAVNAAIRRFDPDRRGPGHSSSMVIKDGKLL